jgi:hypothetical protein
MKSLNEAESTINLNKGFDRDYNNGWFRKGNIYFYKYDWQFPAKTEIDALESLLESNEVTPFVQYICFPWATLIDCLITNNQGKVKSLLVALQKHPPKVSLKVITFCQHIQAFKAIDYFKKLGVTEVFWPHKVVGMDNVEGIKLNPSTLYPVMYKKYQNLYKVKKLSDRDFLYNFIGSHQENLYISDIRQYIFELAGKMENKIIRRKEWHFDSDVYKDQMLGIKVSKFQEALKKKYELEYVECLSNSVFSLCPSGSGPNSIRIWEALLFGSIPVVFSDNLHVPASYKNKIIQLKEDKKSLVEFIAILENNSISEVLNIYGVSVEK